MIESILINPSTSKPILPGAGELYVETRAIKVKNSGSEFSSDQVTFKCPYCDRRNKQNIRFSVARPSGEVASFRCVCSRLVYVRRPGSGGKLLLPGQAAYSFNRLALAGAAEGGKPLTGSPTLKR